MTTNTKLRLLSRRGLVAIAASVLGGCLVGTAIGVSLVPPATGSSAAVTDTRQDLLASEPEPAPERDPRDVIALLASDPSRSAAHLDLTELGDGGLDPASVRSLGEHDGVAYWVGIDKAGSICVVIVFGPDNAGSGCRAAGEVEQSGLQFGFQEPEQSEGRRAIVAALLPDSVGVASPGEPWTALGPNLLVADQRLVAEGSELVVERSPSAGGPLVFRG
jgi:hypothetical protein